jgi:hypothetical protein
MKENLEIPREETLSDHHQLAAGWHLTDKFGDVFVSPDGSVWAVQQSGDRLINVAVKLDSSDIIKTPSIDRVKHAQAVRHYRKTRVTVTRMPDLPLSEAEGMNK